MTASIVYSYPWSYPIAFSGVEYQDSFSRAVLNISTGIAADMYTSVFIGTGAVESVADEAAPDMNLATQATNGSMAHVYTQGWPILYGRNSISKCTITLLTEFSSAADMTMRFGVVGPYPANEAQFRYDSSADPDYQCRTSRDGTTATIDSGSPLLDAQTQNLQIELDGDNEQVLFKLNGATIATQSGASIPNPLSTFSIVLQIRNLAAANKSMALRGLYTTYE
jgi:hypothetical protein